MALPPVGAGAGAPGGAVPAAAPAPAAGPVAPGAGPVAPVAPAGPGAPGAGAGAPIGAGPVAPPAQMQDDYFNKLLNLQGKISVYHDGTIGFETDTINTSTARITVTKVQQQEGRVLLKELPAIYRRYNEPNGKQIVNSARVVVDRSTDLTNIKNAYFSYINTLNKQLDLIKENLTKFDENLNIINDYFNKLNINFNNIIFNNQSSYPYLKQQRSAFYRYEKIFNKDLNGKLVSLATEIGKRLVVFGPNDYETKQLITYYRESFTKVKSLKSNFDDLKRQYETHLPSFRGRLSNSASNALYWVYDEERRSFTSTLTGAVTPYLGIGFYSIATGISISTAGLGGIVVAALPGIAGALVGKGIDSYLKNNNNKVPDLLNIPSGDEVVLGPPTSLDIQEKENRDLVNQLFDEINQNKSLPNLQIVKPKLMGAKDTIENTLKKYGCGTFFGAIAISDDKEKRDVLKIINNAMALAILQPILGNPPAKHNGGKFYSDPDYFFGDTQKNKNYENLRTLLKEINKFILYIETKQDDTSRKNDLIDVLKTTGDDKSLNTQIKYNNYTDDNKILYFNKMKNYLITNIFQSKFEIKDDKKTQEFLDDFLSYTINLGITTDAAFTELVKTTYSALGLSTPNDDLIKAFLSAFKQYGKSE